MKPIGLNAVVIIAFLAAGLACAGDGPGTTDPPIRNNDSLPVGTPFAGFSGEVQPIFTARCALSGCHVGASPGGDMNLEQGQAYGNIVNVMSSSVPTFKRVLPGFPDSSFLVHKIQGTQASVGGSGQRMPLTNCCLSQDQIDLIRSWITTGARNN